jgi:endoglucanase
MKTKYSMKPKRLQARALAQRNPRTTLALVIAAALITSLFADLASFAVTRAFGAASAQAAEGVEVWWPGSGAHVTGTQPFKAMLSGSDVSSYEMFWQVDGGTWNWMDNNSTDYPHKETSVDLSGWNWKGQGPYTVNFIARKNGQVVSQRSVQVYVDSGSRSSVSAALPTPSVQTVVSQTGQTAAQITAAPVSATAQPSQSGEFYVAAGSPAASQADAWRSSRPDDAAAMDMLAQTPTARWFGSWSGDIESAVNSYVSAAASVGETPVLVAYNIPGRDCGGYSSGGTSDYLSWIRGFARGVGGRKALVVLEPDSLAQATCLSGDAQNERYMFLSSAVSALKSAGASVYLDAGHSGWVSADDMAQRLRRANIGAADGFALNVSNFDTTSSEASYGSDLSGKLGGKHYVIDTSRNGNGSSGEWCNPWGRAIGAKPTRSTGNSLIDAYLWLKTPGESDGSCNGGPSAGSWWPDYALGLVRNAH